MPTTARSKDSFKPDENDASWYLLHKGIFAKSLMHLMPDISTFTLCNAHNGDVDVGASMQKATQILLEKYPILRGRVFKTKGTKGRIEYWVKEAVFPTNVEDYFEIIDLSKDGDKQVPSPKDLDSAESFAYLNEHVIPLLGQPLTVGQRARKKLKLFNVLLVLLPDHSYCYCINLCHCLGDATTYYQLVDELVHCIDGETPATTLSWGNDVFTTKELTQSKRDNKTISGLPVLVGILRTIFRYGVKNRFHVTFVDKNKVAKVKQHLKASDVNFLSTNDVLTSIVCKAKPNYEILTYNRNDRKRVDGVSTHDAGIFLSQVGLPVNLSRDANFVHKAVEKGEYYPRDKLPRRTYYRGRNIIMTNWATALADNGRLAPRSSTLVAHVPHPSFVRDLPMVAVLVSFFNEGSLVVMYNFPMKSLSVEGKQLFESISI
jgi:hypothetical protein